MLNTVSNKLEEIEKQVNGGPQGELTFDTNAGLLQFIYMPSTGTGDNNAISFGGSGEAQPDNENGNIANALEPKLRLQHSYFLATMTNFRSTSHFIFDTVMFIMSVMFLLASLDILVNKGQMESYHSLWQNLDMNKLF